LPYRTDGTPWDIGLDADTTAYVATRELKNENQDHGFYRKIDFDADGKITAIGGNIEFPYGGAAIVKLSPVDLFVTDPSGATIDRWSSTIENASYEIYELTPGDTGATVYILHPLPGVYHIAVTPMAGAAPTDDYSLYFANGGDTVWLAQDSLISSIPADGYHVTVINCGDADGEGTVNIADAVYLIAYIFSHGPAPSPLASGDADCSGDINIADVVYLISYIFSYGPEPCAGCK